MSKLTRENAILPFTSSEDFTGKEGYFVGCQHGEVGAIVDSDETPFGVLLVASEPGEPNSIAIAKGGLAGTVKVKLSSTVSVGDSLKLDEGGTVSKFTTAPAMLVAIALEAGFADELIEAAIHYPDYLS